MLGLIRLPCNLLLQPGTCLPAPKVCEVGEGIILLNSYFPAVTWVFCSGIYWELEMGGRGGELPALLGGLLLGSF